MVADFARCDFGGSAQAGKACCGRSLGVDAGSQRSDGAIVTANLVSLCRRAGPAPRGGAALKVEEGKQLIWLAAEPKGREATLRGGTYCAVLGGFFASALALLENDIAQLADLSNAND